MLDLRNSKEASVAAEQNMIRHKFISYPCKGRGVYAKNHEKALESVIRVGVDTQSQSGGKA